MTTNIKEAEKIKMEVKKKTPNSLFAFKTNDDRIILTIVGNVTDGFPFLCKGSTKYVTPFYLKNGETGEIGATSSNTVTIQSSSEVPYAASNVEPLLKNLRIPTVAVNISQAEYARVLEYAPEVGELSKTVQGTKVTVFVPFVAFDGDAIHLHQEVLKGDRVAMTAVLKRTAINIVDRKILAAWVERIDLINQSKKNLTAASVDC